MNLGRLVRRQAWSHPVRILLTVSAVAFGMFLFCFLRSIVTSLEAAVTASATNRIVVGSAVSLFQSLPVSYREKIASMEGVDAITTFTWFGGLYQGPEGFFAQFGSDAAALLDIYPEVDMPAAERQAWIEDRQGAIIGRGLADKYGWKVGDTVPLIGTIYPRVDGSEWRFNIRGVYRSRAANVDEQTLFFHWSYLDETLEREEAYGPRGTSVYVVRIAGEAAPAAAAAAIDGYYAGGPQRTRTQTEAAFQAGFINMLGNVPTFLGTIGTAVLIALFFGVVNAMTIAARERVRSMGILQSLGFPRTIPARLYVMESSLIVVGGGLLGIAMARASVPGFRDRLGTQVPYYDVAPDTIVLALVLCLAMGFLAGAVPAWRAVRLRAVDALRRGA